MGKFTDRTGEINYNKFGSKMIITNTYMKFNDKYKRNYTYVDVYFPEYNWTAKNKRYKHFKDGEIKCPYEKRIYGVGYLGEGKYKTTEDGRITRVYATWHDMLRRCYDPKCHKKHPTYKECIVRDEWLNFQVFAEWYYNNYYEIKGEVMCLDKDILNKGNKIYSPDTCMFVPQTINNLFIKSNKIRGDLSIGTTLYKGKYRVHCNLINSKTRKSKLKHLGLYDTQEKAFEAYREFKEKNIKDVADYYKELIPKKLYDAMYNYQVEITD